MKLLGITLSVALAVLSQAPNLQAQPLVCSYAGERIERCALAEDASDAAFELADTEGLETVWIWSPDAAPRKVEVVGKTSEEITAALATALPTKDRERLTVEIALPESEPARASAKTDDTDAPNPYAGLRVAAAPAEMWNAVPEHLLPRWPVQKNGSASLPRDPGRAWRVRITGQETGSWWLDVPAGRATARLEAVPAGHRELSLVGADGETLIDAGLTVMEDERGRQRVLAHYRPTDRGGLRLPSLPDHGELVVIASAPGHASRGFSVWPSALPAELRLDAGGSLRGRFVDAEGEPIEGVAVHADAWLDPSLGAVAARQTVSDADGSFDLDGLPRGEVAVAARRPGRAAWKSHLELDGETVDLGEIELFRGQTLDLLAVDDLGEPIPGAVLATESTPECSTNVQGRARFEDLPPDAALTIYARADGHRPTTTSVAAPLPEEPVRVVLERAFRIEGRLVDNDGLPVHEGTVRHQTGRRYDEHELENGGRFALDLESAASAVVAPEIELVLRSPRTREARLTVTMGAPGETLDLGDVRTPPGLVLRGRVVRDVDGAPVAGARVWTPRPSQDGDIVAWVHGDLVEATSGDDGTFELSGLPRQPVLLRVDAPRLARAHLRAEPPEDGDVVDLGEVILGDGARVRITIEEEGDGRGTATARVDVRGEWRELDMLTASVVGGEAVVRNVPPGPSTLTVLKGRDLLCERALDVPPGGGELDVDCRDEALRVDGRVVLGGQPAGAGRLIFMTEQTPGHGIIFSSKTPLGAGRQRVYGVGRPQVDVEVDAAGNFTTDALHPGAWQVTFSPAVGSTTAPRTIDLPAAAGSARMHRLDLLFDADTVAGVVVDGGDRPVWGARVREVANGAFTMTGGDGRFTFTGLGPGRHRLHARLGEERSGVVEAVIEPDRAAEPVTLRLGEGREDRVEIVVVDADGLPAAGSFVFLEGDNGQNRLLTTDIDGRATLELPPPVPARIRAAAVNDGRWAFGTWAAVDRVRDEGLALEVPETGTLELSAEDARGVAEIVSPEGWNLSWLLTRIGDRPIVDPRWPLLVRGLPEGRYQVGLGDFITAAAVRVGTRAEIELP